MATKMGTMKDASVQTDQPPPPPYDESASEESIERLKRFLLNNLRREYNVEGYTGLPYRELTQWVHIGLQPYRKASKDRRKFDQSLDDLIERPCRALEINPNRAWICALATGKGFFRDAAYREFIREDAQESAQKWAKKLYNDRILVPKLTADAKSIDALIEAIGKEVDTRFTRLNSEIDWELTAAGETFWSWKRPWM